MARFKKFVPHSLVKFQLQNGFFFWKIAVRIVHFKMPTKCGNCRFKGEKIKTWLSQGKNKTFRNLTFRKKISPPSATHSKNLDRESDGFKFVVQKLTSCKLFRSKSDWKRKTFVLSVCFENPNYLESLSCRFCSENESERDAFQSILFHKIWFLKNDYLKVWHSVSN